MNIQTDILDKLTPEMIAEMQHIHFTADLHFDHPKIVDICNRPVYLPLNPPEDFERSMADPKYKELINKAHNEWLIKEVFNKYVQNKDEVYVLGDVSLGNRKEAEKLVARLNGNKHLITGNHDKSVDHLGNWSEITQIKDFTFSRFGINIHIVLCHYCLASYNRQIYGSWHVFGHSHCRPVEGQPKLSFDVGIDRIGLWRPYNLYEICKIMNGKELGYSEEIILKLL